MSKRCISFFLLFFSFAVFGQKKRPEIVFQDKSEFKIFNANDQDWFTKTEVTYDIFHFKRSDHKYLVKKTLSGTYSETEFFGSKLELDIFEDFQKSKTFHYALKADKFDVLNGNVLKFIEYGCCGSEDYHVFYSFPSKTPFLKAESNYYQITFPESEHRVYFGMDGLQRQLENKSTYVELYMSINGEKPQITNIKLNPMKSGTKDNWVPLSLEYIKVDTFDTDIEDGALKELLAYSHKGLKDIKAINGLGIRLTFDLQGYKKPNKTYDLIFKNGELILPKEIVVDI